MEKYEKPFCKLCLGVINDRNFKAIEEIIREVLDILLLKLSAQQRNVLARCEACSTKLFAAFNFKATCMDTEDSIFPYVNSGRGTPIDLREVYLKERGKELLKDILGDERICRLCMQVVTCDFTAVEEVDVGVLCKFIPEVNFSSTKENVICKICVDLLDIHTSFLNNISYEKDVINDICNDATESLFSIKCEEVEIKSEDNDSDNPLPTLKDECASECRSKYVEKKNNSTLKRKKKGQGSEGKYDGLKRNKKKRSGSKIKQKRYFDNHQLTHKDISEHRYKCDLCDYKSKRKGNFDSHQLTHKDISEVQRYKCDMCDFETKWKRNLKDHLVKHKTIPEEQMFKCDSCEYKSKREIYLANHRLRHDIPEEQMYKCDLCDYKTFYKNYFKMHQVIHKDVPEEQMFKCDSCEYKTKHKVNLKRHQLRHKYIPDDQMFKCDLCDYKTRRKICLTKHQWKHKDIPEEMMFKCDLCNYRTIFKNNLMKHQITHRNIPQNQMYKCGSCNYKAVRKSYLALHRLKHKNTTKDEQCM